MYLSYFISKIREKKLSQRCVNGDGSSDFMVAAKSRNSF